MQVQYIKHPIEELNNNPLTEALQVIESKNEIKDRLTKIPTTEIDGLNSFYRNARIGLLRNLHIPHECSANMYHKIMELILTCYANKNPFDLKIMKATYAIADEAKKNSYVKFGFPELTTAPSCLAYGPSGSCKSTTIRHALSIIPQVISHTNFSGKPFIQDQLVWISVDCPATPSTKSLALNFFKAVDKALGTSYAINWQSKNATVDSHLGHMQLIAMTHCLGFVHIDELQFLLKYAKTKDAPSLTIFEALFNKLGIPIMLTTTTAGLALFKESDSDITTSRRMLSEREFKFSTFKLNSSMFNVLFDALYPPTLCINGVTPSDEFKERFHHLTAGLPAVMTRLARLHHEFAWSLKQNENIKEKDVALLNRVFKGQFSIIDNALNHLRLGNVMAFEKKLQKTETGNTAWTNNEAAIINEEKTEDIAIPEIIEGHLENDTAIEKSADPIDVVVGLLETHKEEI